MTLKDYQNRVHFAKIEDGKFEVSCEAFGHKRTCITTNTMAIDRINESGISSRSRGETGITLLQAYLSLWEECMEVNNINQ